MPALLGCGSRTIEDTARTPREEAARGALAKEIEKRNGRLRRIVAAGRLESGIALIAPDAGVPILP
jgi:hypothetical protein